MATEDKEKNEKQSANIYYERKEIVHMQ